MAYTSYGVNDALAVKLWSKYLAVEALKATEIAPLIGENSNSIIQLKTETQKGAGDRITCGLRMQLSGDGFSEADTAEGNGESLTTYSDNLLINELGHVVGVKSQNTIDAQRVQFDLRAEARAHLPRRTVSIRAPAKERPPCATRSATFSCFDPRPREGATRPSATRKSPI